VVMIECGRGRGGGCCAAARRDNGTGTGDADLLVLVCELFVLFVDAGDADPIARVVVVFCVGGGLFTNRGISGDMLDRFGNNERVPFMDVILAIRR
jgi:hypothetical protein